MNFICCGRAGVQDSIQSDFSGLRFGVAYFGGFQVLGRVGWKGSIGEIRE